MNIWIPKKPKIVLPWQKPDITATLNTNHPLAQGMLNCHLLAEGTGLTTLDLVTLNNAVLNAGLAARGGGWTNGPDGPAVSFDGNNDGLYLGGPGPSGVQRLSAHSCFARIAWQDNGDISSVYMESRTSARSLMLGIDALDCPFYMLENAAGVQNCAGSTTVTANEWIDIAGTFSTTDGMRVYLNGVQDGTLANFTPGNRDILYRLIGLDYKSYYDFKGSIGLVYVYSRWLSPEEMAWLHEDPYAMFTLPTRYIMVSTDTGGLVTYDLPYTTQVMLQTTENVNYFANILLQTTVNVNHTADILLRTTVNSSYFANVLLQTTVNVNHTADALLQTTVNTTYGANGILQSINNLQYVTNVLLRTTNTTTYSADVVRQKTTNINYIATMLLYATINADYTADIILRTSNNISYTTDILCQKRESISYNANVSIRAEVTTDYSAQLVMYSTSEVNYSSTVLLMTTNNSIYYNDIVLQGVVHVVYLADVVKQAITTDIDITYAATVELCLAVTYSADIKINSGALYYLPRSAGRSKEPLPKVKE